jgi:hypothetical protein
MRRQDIAFGVALVAIGYNFLPVKAPNWLSWVAAITLLGIGGCIIFRGISQRKAS